ncbi:MAG: DUF881 domain-containing protein [Ruminiclostridium sp.]|nr:DUF881 domain-containing protein [Ruminiclostridium sp.]
MVTRSKSILFVIFLLFGMVITMQTRSILLTQQQKSNEQTSIQSLSAELEQVKKEGLELQENLRMLEEEMEEVIKRFESGDNPTLNELVKTRKSMQLINGFTGVRGDGVVITLNDAPARTEVDPSELIIHDSDITAILNDLKAAGAQALSINDERIIATSKQLCTGPTILINKDRYPVPYIIKAIGDQEALYNALEQSESVFIMRIYNIRVDFRKEKDILVPRFKVYENIDKMISGMEVVDK